MFCERFVEVFDGRSQVTGLGESSPDTSVSLSDKLVVRPDLGRQIDKHASNLRWQKVIHPTAFFNGFLTSLDTLFVLALFKVDSYRNPLSEQPSV